MALKDKRRAAQKAARKTAAAQRTAPEPIAAPPPPIVEVDNTAVAEALQGFMTDVSTFNAEMIKALRDQQQDINRLMKTQEQLVDRIEKLELSVTVDAQPPVRAVKLGDIVRDEDGISGCTVTLDRDVH